MSSLFGLDVYVCPDSPRIQLSARLAEIIGYAKPEFVAETNAWLLARFGTTNSVADDQALISPLAGKIFVNPRTYEAMKNDPQTAGTKVWA